MGYVPTLKPLLNPLDEPVVAFPLLNPVVSVELPMLLEPAAPVAATPPVTPAPCARAMDELAARAEAKTIVVSFIRFSLP